MDKGFGFLLALIKDMKKVGIRYDAYCVDSN